MENKQQYWLISINYGICLLFLPDVHDFLWKLIAFPEGNLKKIKQNKRRSNVGETRIYSNFSFFSHKAKSLNENRMNAIM